MQVKVNYLSYKIGNDNIDNIRYGSKVICVLKNGTEIKGEFLSKYKNSFITVYNVKSYEMENYYLSEVIEIKREVNESMFFHGK